MPVATNTSQTQRLGVAWVLRQAAVLAVLSLTAVHLAGVICLAAAEQQLSRAAKASASEAGLPAASSRSIRNRVVRLLQKEGVDARNVKVDVQCNGRVLRDRTRLRSGDEVLLTVGTSSRTFLPPVVARLAPWLAGEYVVSEATVIVPSE